MMAGMLPAKKTSQFSDVFRVVRPALEVLVSDCCCVEWAWPARIGQVEAVTRAIPKVFEMNSRLEVIVASFG